MLKQSTFPIFRNFLPNHGRILPALTYNGLQPLIVNAGRILPGFGRKLRNIGKLDYVETRTDYKDLKEAKAKVETSMISVTI